MPVAVLCPSCAAPLSETSVLALAPVCTHCGVVITSIGGTLGLTSAYGVGDPTITRRRVEADLAVFREYRMKYEGMLEACIQQLEWGAERYAKLPQSPELLEVRKTLSFSAILFTLTAILVLSGLIWWTLPFYVGFTDWNDIVIFGKPIIISFNSPHSYLQSIADVHDRGFMKLFLILIADPLKLIVIGAAVWMLLLSLGALFVDYRARVANGNRPQENARRQKTYEEAKAAALKAAERSKAAEDHRLRLQIRELERLAKTVAAKEAEVSRILGTL